MLLKHKESPALKNDETNSRLKTKTKTHRNRNRNKHTNSSMKTQTPWKWIEMQAILQLFTVFFLYSFLFLRCLFYRVGFHFHFSFRSFVRRFSILLANRYIERSTYNE